MHLSQVFDYRVKIAITRKNTLLACIIFRVGVIFQVNSSRLRSPEPTLLTALSLWRLASHVFAQVSSVECLLVEAHCRGQLLRSRSPT